MEVFVNTSFVDTKTLTCISSFSVNNGVDKMLSKYVKTGVHLTRVLVY